MVVERLLSAGSKPGRVGTREVVLEGTGGKGGKGEGIVRGERSVSA